MFVLQNIKDPVITQGMHGVIAGLSSLVVFPNKAFCKNEEGKKKQFFVQILLT